MSRLARIVGGIVSAIMVLFAVCVPAAHAEPVTASDKISDAIVAMKVIFNAQMFIPGAGNVPGAWTKSVETRYICEGYFVDDTASIATTSGCVDTSDSTLRRSIIEETTADYNWTEKQVEDFIDQANNGQWNLRASESDSSSRYALDLTVRQTTGDNRLLPDWTKATVVKFDDRVSGGSQNALIKLDQPRSGLPFLRIAKTAPAISDRVTVYGFPEDAKTTSEPTPPPLLQEGTVAARPVSSAGVTLTQVSNKLLSGSLGGPVVDADGEVVGTVNNYQGTRSDDASENTASDTSGLSGFLTQNGVTLAEPASDDADSSALVWVIVAIAVVAVLAIAILVVVLLVKRSRKNAPPAGQFAAPMGTASDQWSVSPQYPGQPQYPAQQYPAQQYPGEQNSQPQHFAQQYPGGPQSQPHTAGNYDHTVVAPSWPPVTPGTGYDGNSQGLPFADPPDERR